MKTHAAARIVGLLALMLAGILLPAPLAAAPHAGLPRPAVLNRYELDVAYDPAAMTLVGTERLQLTNTREVAFSELWFHLFPNADAFQRSPRTGAPLARPGSLVLSDVRVDGQAVATDRESFHLRVSLPRAVAPNDSVTVDFGFVTTLPSTDNRFGVSGSVANVTSWYPTLAVYDHDGWRRDAYIALGDPFYSEVAAYQVRVWTPAAYTVAATGVLAERAEAPEGVAWLFAAGPVRDFALAISDRFTVRERETLGTTIRDYAAERTGPEIAEQALDAAADAVSIYTDLFGPYPYPDLAVVHSDDGMEYPQLVFVFYSVEDRVGDGPGRDEAARRLNENVVIHEVAHQWWYGVAGNDELRDLWDESLARYSELLFYERRYGRDLYEQRLREAVRSYQSARRAAPDQMCVGCDLAYYAERPGAYSAGIYAKGAVMFDALRRQVGDDLFFAFLRAFYQRHQFATATWADLIATASDVTGQDLSGFFADWLAPGGGQPMLGTDGQQIRGAD